MAALAFENVEKRYGKQAILRGIDLKVSEGEYVGLVGVNGAGKTTLIKMLLDFSQADAGHIEIFGISHRETQARDNLAYLPERFTPPFYLNGQQFLAYMARLHGTKCSQHDLDETIAALDLDPAALGKPVRTLSKGMSQKLGLAACLLAQCNLLVLDEPMSGLDPKARAMVEECLLERKQKGQTLFYTTHLLHDVETLCDRLAILHQGRLAFVGTPAECCEQYQQGDLEKAYLMAIGSTNI
jgi:ABC-2 type transport system ATP-binding protein